MLEVFKVFRIYPDASLNSLQPGFMHLSYAPLIPTVASIPSSMMFAFQTEELAVSFLGGYTNWNHKPIEVWRCQADVVDDDDAPTKILNLNYLVTQRIAADFWQRGLLPDYGAGPAAAALLPDGTVFCTRLTPMLRVWPTSQE